MVPLFASWSRACRYNDKFDFMDFNMPFRTNQAVTAEGKQTGNASTFKDFLDSIHILKAWVIICRLSSQLYFFGQNSFNGINQFHCRPEQPSSQGFASLLKHRHTAPSSAENEDCLSELDRWLQSHSANRTGNSNVQTFSVLKLELTCNNNKWDSKCCLSQTTSPRCS